MRLIKFRIWDEIERKMHYSAFNVSFSGSNSGEVVDAGWRDPSKNFGIRCILMQYIGIKDKNGREIYEGDVVKSSAAFTLQKVEWGDFHSGFIFCGGSFIKTSCPNCYTNEIIGNVYENPELIKE